jgi:hypothetical protein
VIEYLVIAGLQITRSPDHWITQGWDHPMFHLFIYAQFFAFRLWQ